MVQEGARAFVLAIARLPDTSTILDIHSFMCVTEISTHRARLKFSM